ncbi:MAG: hypothetical protein KDC26_08370 [Armatimonadetes bacterium]|nr:hypothetical protein [Armatimonadota bacterium]
MLQHGHGKDKGNGFWVIVGILAILGVIGMLLTMSGHLDADDVIVGPQRMRHYTGP